MNAEKADEKIRQEILHGLLFVPGIEPGNVGVEVEAGMITLSGHVPHRSAFQAAEQLARRATGVHSVANRIVIHRPLDDSQHDVNLVRAVVDAFGRGHESVN